MNGLVKEVDRWVWMEIQTDKLRVRENEEEKLWFIGR